MGTGIALLEQVLAGEPAAFAELTEAGWPRFGTGIIRSGLVERADLRQEAAEVLLAAAQSYDPAQGDFRAVAVARVRQRLRKILCAERRRRSRVQPMEVSENEEPEAVQERFVAEIEDPRLAGALRRLSPRLRAVIARAYWQGASIGQIAHAEGTTADTVRTARRRALVLLRLEMDRRGWRRRG